MTIELQKQDTDGLVEDARTTKWSMASELLLARLDRHDGATSLIANLRRRVVEGFPEGVKRGFGLWADRGERLRRADSAKRSAVLKNVDQHRHSGGRNVSESSEGVHKLQPNESREGLVTPSWPTS